MAIGIDPTVDFAFKKLLGSPDHPAITLHFLNAVLGGDPLITEVEILNPIIGKDFDEDKLAILDVKARDAQGRLFNVEMQTSVPSELPSRLAYYVASLYVGQLREGDHYVDLRPAIGICVLDGVLFRRNPAIHLDFRLRSQAAEELLTDALQVHLLELPKYRPPSDNRSITDPIEAWACFFQQAENLTTEELASRLSDSAFTEAAGVLEMIARNPEERSQYEARLKLQRDERARLQAAEERGEKRGEKRGRAQGELIGRIQLLRQLLDQTASEDLDQLSLDDLATLEAELQRQLRERG